MKIKKQVIEWEKIFMTRITAKNSNLTIQIIPTLLNKKITQNGISQEEIQIIHKNNF